MIANLRIAKKSAEQLLKTLEENNIITNWIYLKQVDNTTFKFLFIVAEESFESPDFVNAYKISHALINQYCLENLAIEFSYLGDGQSICTDCIIADGYLLHFSKIVSCV